MSIALPPGMHAGEMSPELDLEGDRVVYEGSPARRPRPVGALPPGAARAPVAGPHAVPVGADLRVVRIRRAGPGRERAPALGRGPVRTVPVRQMRAVARRRLTRSATAPTTTRATRSTRPIETLEPVNAVPPCVPPGSGGGGAYRRMPVRQAPARTERPSELRTRSASCDVPSCQTREVPRSGAKCRGKEGPRATSGGPTPDGRASRRGPMRRRSGRASTPERRSCENRATASHPSALA